MRVLDAWGFLVCAEVAFKRERVCCAESVSPHSLKKTHLECFNRISEYLFLPELGEEPSTSEARFIRPFQGTFFPASEVSE